MNRSVPSPHAMSASSWNVSSAARPASTAALNSATVASCARNRSLRWASVTCDLALHELHSPVERGIATADDQHSLTSELVGVGDDVVDTFSIPRLGAWLWKPSGRKRSDPSRDEQRAGWEPIRLADEHEMPVAFLETDDALTQVHRRPKPRRLFRQLADEVLGENLGKPRDVEDVFFRIERRELTAELRQRIDDLRRDAPHPGVERGEETRRPTTNDGDVAKIMIHGLNNNGRAEAR